MKYYSSWLKRTLGVTFTVWEILFLYFDKIMNTYFVSPYLPMVLESCWTVHLKLKQIKQHYIDGKTIMLKLFFWISTFPFFNWTNSISSSLKLITTTVQHFCAETITRLLVIFINAAGIWCYVSYRLWINLSISIRKRLRLLLFTSYFACLSRNISCNIVQQLWTFLIFKQIENTQKRLGTLFDSFW